MSVTATMPKTAEEGYETFKRLVFDQVHKFHRRYGGDFDDLVGEAGLAFTKGHQALVEKKIAPEMYPVGIRRWVWYELFDAMRVQLERKRKVRFSSTDADGADYMDTKKDFDKEDFESGLTEDARYAVNLVLNPPPAVAKMAEAKGGTPRNYKSTVRTHLKGEGWTTERINAAFEQITEALG